MKLPGLGVSSLLRKYQFELFTALSLTAVTGLFARFARAIWFYELQAGLLVCLVAGVVHYFWPRRGLYWDLFLTNPLIALAIPLLVALSYGKLLPNFGFHYLFWSQPPWHPLLSSFAVVITIAVHWLLLYFLYVDSYDVSLDPARGGDGDGSGRGLGRFEQSHRHAQRLWREFGFDRELTGNQPGWFVYESTKPFAVLLTIPALLPRFAIVKASGEGPYLTSDQFLIPTFWLAGVALGLMCVYASRAWIGSAARLDWVLRDRRQPERQEGVSQLLDVSKIFAVLTPLIVGLMAMYHASQWHPAYSTGFTIAMIALLFTRAYRLRCDTPSVSGLPAPLYHDYLFVLIGIFCFFLGFSLLIRLIGGAFATTVSLCYLMIVVSSLIALLDWFFTSQSYVRQMTTVGVLLLLLLVNGINPYKLQYDGLTGYYPDRLFGTGPGSKGPTKLRVYQKEEDDRLAEEGKGVKPPLLDDGEVLEKWAAFRERTRPDSGDKPKLVVVACSGGALRAAIWTALVLGMIEEEVDDFPQSLRLITGASGGMLGAAHYVTALESRLVNNIPVLRSPTTGKKFAKQLHQDFLTGPIQHLVFGDALTVPHPLFQALDRGKVLERGWGDQLKGLDRKVTFETLLKEEQHGERPSLVFTPMIVEDSRRLFISNLDLRQFTVNHGRFDPVTRAKKYNRPDVGATGKPEGTSANDVDKTFPHYSRVGYQFFRLFPEAHVQFPVSAAVRMSATFPFISPTVNLPTEPPLRVVDAGYYDNYGVDMATAWLGEHSEWLLRNTSGVALIQIRAFTNEEKLGNYPAVEAGGTTSDRAFRAVSELFDRGGQFLTTPLTGVANARQMVMSYRNDNKVESLKRHFTFERLEALTGLHGNDLEAADLDPEARQKLITGYERARNFFRVFTFTCGEVSQPDGEGSSREAPDPKAARSGLPASPTLPEVETMNWFVTEAEFGQFTGEFWRKNLRRFNLLIDWLKITKPGPPSAIQTSTTSQITP